ncbi:DEAD-box ATP-dependent RNA helicase 31-like [Tasmannia lanceolata]|uniref:DEAD-box ATP-dependent RNA helicase 31-like n=1 Tax=Tasmannia lanceolata TaxID=3420 RepID=UPI00406440BC
MAGQLLPLRLLNSSVPARNFSHTKLGPAFHSSRGISIFITLFPLKLKYVNLCAKSQYLIPCKEDYYGMHRFSTRPLQSRNGRNPELSNWIGDMKTDSIERGGNEGFSFSNKRRNKNGSDDYEDGILSSEESEEGSDMDVFMSASSLHSLAKEDIQQSAPTTSTGTTDSYLSRTRFDQCSISPLSLKGIKAAGYERMTLVQEATLPVILEGKDVLAKARTGTGKTVAFLLPAIEAIVKLPPPDRDQKRPPINVLIICPTRELATQAATEANALLKYHPSIGVQVVIGGTRLPLEQKRMQAYPCQILVATPGRLKDHIENTPGFATRLKGVRVLVLDEADHLLDMGFRRDIEKLIAAVPKQRQTLLFSATVPEEVRQICYIALKRDHKFINTVEEGSEETHSQVTQMHLVAPLDKHFSILYGILTEHISEDVDYKVLVFCTTAMVTRLVANLLSELKLNVREIHSRKPQSYRTRVSDEFRKSKGLILLTSDVSARGVDYPDVTLVIQVGVPADREQYIHRLGRTGRKGKEGNGILLLAPWEDFFLAIVKDLPITKAPLPPIDLDTRKKVERALSHVEMKNKEAAYQAWLGYYNSNKSVGRDKYKLVELANEFSRSMGLDNPPSIPKVVLCKMGLKSVPGLRTK